MEKVEILCRTATAQQIFPTRRITLARFRGPAADPAPVVTRWRPQARPDDRQDRKASLPEISHFAAEF
jgi:hypothetical protein